MFGLLRQHSLVSPDITCLVSEDSTCLVPEDGTYQVSQKGESVRLDENAEINNFGHERDRHASPQAHIKPRRSHELQEKVLRYLPGLRDAI